MDLQTALIVAGLVLLLLVVVYNQWQIRKARRPRALQPDDDVAPMREPTFDLPPGADYPAASAKAPSMPDRPAPAAAKESEPAPAAQRREPTLSASPLDAAAAIGAAASTDADQALADEVAVAANVAATNGEGTEATATADRGDEAEPAATVQQHLQDTAPEALEGQPLPAVIDPLVDCIVPLHLERKASGDRILPLTGRLRRAGTKQVHIEGLHAEANAWEVVTAGHQYEDLQVAVQLANRSGPLNALEFSEFVNAVQGLAEALDGATDLPDMSESVANGRELDSFAASCDVQLGVNVISDGAPWSAAYVQTVATQDGLVLSRDGTRFTRYLAGADGVQRALFTLQFGDTNFLRDDLTVKAGRQITLLLDVPQVARASKPFKTVCEYGHSLAQRMGARLVDDNMRPLSEASFIAIFGQLEVLYDKLEARGMPAGSPVALRLFSN
ncbi:cell division protein FtsZ [Cupriavidus sp. USMAA2-4]|uniref:Cell division protein ZipA n=1 Tax=Cupriavidus malaysiensis TaxID=367825 RepID=A0ABN4TG47_9BURK|nr:MULTISPECIES: cell division protein ZipA C-terminal FtsZ-binding domain-containing protein [Cupriavidus]AOY90926.1 cell division protein FtsZ [Cupriavidus sp. USMAA2-4]AOZ06118.1 cell division protein FtsZ [Cupriavidus malaysiensis]